MDDVSANEAADKSDDVAPSCSVKPSCAPGSIVVNTGVAQGSASRSSSASGYVVRRPSKVQRPWDKPNWWEDSSQSTQWSASYWSNAGQFWNPPPRSSYSSHQWEVNDPKDEGNTRRRKNPSRNLVSDREVTRQLIEHGGGIDACGIGPKLS